MRNTIEIEIWMMRKKMTVGQIRQDLGYRSHACVSLTIAGKRNTRRVLQYLKDAGCPRDLLDLPKDMEDAA